MRIPSVSALMLSACFLSAPAYALDVGVDGDVGGVGVGVDVGVSDGGVSVGVDVDVDGVGGVGVSGTGGTTADVDVDTVGPSGVDESINDSVDDTPAGANVGDVSTEDTTANPGTVSPSAAPPGKASATPPAKGASAPIKVAKSVKSQAAILPKVLRPRGERSQRGAFGYPSLARLRIKPGVSPALVRQCRNAITAAARPLGATRVEAASAGTPQRIGKRTSAPIEVRIQYARLGGLETRQAKISCRLDANGKVVALL